MKAVTWWRRAHSLQHVLRTTLAALVSVAIASLIALPEAYWAAITTLVVMQSSLESTLTQSARRLVGTALGAVLGALLFLSFGHSLTGFGLGVLLSGLACIAIGRCSNKLSGYVDRTAYRFAGITLAVVQLIPNPQNIWIIALHRFIEVSVGILVALAFTRLWAEETESEAAADSSSPPRSAAAGVVGD